MKIKILFIVVFLSSQFVSFGQIKNGIVIYKAHQIKKIFTNKKDSNFVKFSSIEKKMIKALKEIEFKLKFSKNKSSFQKIKTLKTENDKYFRFALIASKGNSVFYTFGDKTLEKTYIFDEDFFVLKNKLNWELVNKSKQIGKYKCFKAITKVTKLYKGKPIQYLKTAWYCPQINAPYGPLGYNGLPGLILELVDGNFGYTAQKITLNLKKSLKIKPKLKGKKITEAKMNAIFSEAIGNFKKRN